MTPAPILRPRNGNGTFSHAHELRNHLLILATAVFVFFTGLGDATWDEDEPEFARVAREMMISGDMVTPTFNFHLFPDKPALGVLVDGRVVSPVRRDGIRGPLSFGVVGRLHRAGDIPAWPAIVPTSGRALGRLDHGHKSDVRRDWPRRHVRFDAGLFHHALAVRAGRRDGAGILGIDRRYIEWIENSIGDDSAATLPRSCRNPGGGSPRCTSLSASG